VNIQGLLALRGQPPKVDTRTAEAVALDLYGLTARAVSLEGERDRNFRLETSDGRRLVLKFIDHEADDVVVAGQSAALAHIAEQNAQLPVPRIIPTRTGEHLGVVQIAGYNSEDTALSCRVRLVTYLPGRLIHDVKSDQAEAAAHPAGSATDPPQATHRGLLRSVGNQIAQLDRALAGFFHPALAQPIAWDVRRAPSLMPVLPQVKSLTTRRLVSSALDPIQRLLPQLRGLRSQAIHGDCHGRNLIVNDRDTCDGIIDLGDMIHAPLVLEIAVTMADFLTDSVAPLDALPELLTGYTSAQPLEHVDVNVLYDLITARIAIGVLIQAWREHNNPGVGTGVSADARNQEEMSANALDALASRGKDRLTEQWLDVTTTAESSPAAEAGARRGGVLLGNLLRRRHNALGANAELSYNEPLHLVRGEGVWVHTADGELLLDVYNNVPHVGHAHPAVVAAIANQAKRIASNTRYLDVRIIEYAERLTATLPPDLDTCLFVNSGSEANDIAWRIAKSHTGQHGALVMTHAYHGITDAITALSPSICAHMPPHVEQLAAPVCANSDAAVVAAAEADVAAATARLAARGFAPAALMIDSALTSTGIFDPTPAWIAPIAAAVRKAGGLIIGDEVQFGLGRSGSDFWGFARRGYHPDIVTLGKPVGNGYPLGVVITQRAILEKFQRDTGFFSTFGGNPVAGAAGMAVLDVLERERLAENARTTGDYFIKRLRELATKHDSVRGVRGCGLLIGVEVTDRMLTKRLVNGLREHGVLIGSEGPLGNVLKLRPPMPFRPEHVDIVINALTATLSDAHP
jgi:4-aminobutyrate aminotransferase-like enzyme/Ser/Thr protein kinase RdoA (MazF antagonist)